MTNYPNVPFTDGSDFLPGHADLAFKAPIFDGQTQYLGHRNKLQDNELEPTGVISRVATITDSFAVAHVSALTVSVQGGVLYLPNATRQVKSLTNIIVPDNAESYVWYDSLGVLRATTTYDTYATVLAKVTSVAGVVTAIEPWHRVEYKRMLPPSRLIKVFGGSSVNDIVCTQGQVLPPVVICRRFTVPAGIAVTFSNYCKILCQDFIVDGTITGVSTIKGGEGTADISSGGSTTVSGFTGFGIGGGQIYSPGTTYSFLMQPYGSGGASPNWATTSDSAGMTYDIGDGGNGGCGLYVEASRDITVNGTVNCKGGDAMATTASTADKIVAGGAGGGAGGTIVYISLGKCIFGASAIHDIRGGNGSNGFGNYNQQIKGLGGGNGGGGQMWIFCANANPGTSQVLLTPGTKGANSTSAGSLTYSGSSGGSNGGSGGDGNGGSRPGTVGLFNIITEIPIGL
jgi:hypothetical protein